MSKLNFTGVYDSDLTLTTKKYLVSGNLSFVNNAVLTIMPGTVLKFSDSKKLRLTIMQNYYVMEK